jgi:hypothetical protein
MNNITRFTVAPSSVAELKSNIFSYHTKQTVEFKRDEAFVYEDENWKVELLGYKLNQIHRDILDIIFYYGDNSFDGKLEGNRFMRTISLYKIKKHLGYVSNGNLKWVVKKIQEIQQTLIALKNKIKEEKWTFAAIETAKHSEKLNTYAVIIHPLYYTFFTSQIALNYSFYLDDILKLRFGITKAVVRYLLTHQAGHQINVNNLLKKIGIRGNKRNLEKHRANLLQELKEIGEKFNIELIKTTTDKRKTSDITIKYTKLPEIKFYHQLP